MAWLPLVGEGSGFCLKAGTTPLVDASQNRAGHAHLLGVLYP